MDATEIELAEGELPAQASGSFGESRPSAEERLPSGAIRSHTEYKEPHNALEGKPLIV